MTKAPYQSVSIRPGLDACRAVWMIVGERYLPSEAPDLPLPGCDKSRCDCTFNQHDDRREPGERREPVQAKDSSDTPTEHRSGKGRRQDD